MMSSYYQGLRQLLGHQCLLIPSVAGLVYDSQKRLLLQRKADGLWSLPAGAIEPGESPQQAMQRELLEETGLFASRLELVRALGGSEFRYVYPNGDQVEYSIFVFRCLETHHQSTELDPETQALTYFAEHEFPGLTLPYPMDLLY